MTENELIINESESRVVSSYRVNVSVHTPYTRESEGKGWERSRYSAKKIKE